MADYLPPTENLPQFNTAVFQSATQVLTLEEANNLYLGRIGTPNSIASATTFSGSISTPLINTANTIDIQSAFNLCNIDIGNDNFANLFPGSGNVAIGSEIMKGAGLLGASNSNVGIGVSVLTGLTAGETNVVIGTTVGNSITSGNSNVVIGNTANVSAGGVLTAVAIGNDAIVNTSGVSIGNNAGGALSGTAAIAIGLNAGSSSQGQNAVAIGSGAGTTTQSGSAVAIGAGAGTTTQGASSIAIGLNAANNNQGAGGAIAIGANSGLTNQGDSAIAIGNDAGRTTQVTNAVAIGNSAGNSNQSTNAIAIGQNSGQTSQAASAIAIGNSAGFTGQSNHAIAIGTNAGGTNGQGSDAIAIGRQAGRGTTTAQGANAIAIGQQAGIASQVANSIVLNAQTATALNPSTATLWIKPLTTVAYSTAANYAPLAWNSSTGEVSSITSSTLKTVGTLANTAMVSGTFYNYFAAGLSVPIGTYIVEIYAQATTTALAGSITNFKAGLSTALGAFTAGTGGLQLLGTTSYPAVAGTPSGIATTVLQNAAITTYYFVAQMTFTTIVPTTAAAASYFSLTRIA